MEYIYIGKIVNTHALKGEVRCLSNFRYKDKVFKKGMSIYIGSSKTPEVISNYRHHKIFDMIMMENYNNIDDILKYKGMNIYINRNDLQLNSNEYLDTDLIGLDVIINNKKIGKIKNIQKRPMQDLFIIKCSKKDCLIPYVSDIIEEINLNDGYIRINYIKGLI